MHEILSNEQMAEADRLTIEAGTSSYSLMKAAGRAVADIASNHYPDKDFLVLCGPGNNGGDGYVVAQCLKQEKCRVSVASLVPVNKLSGDAERACKEFGDEIFQLEDVLEDRFELNNVVVIDALFGTGLSRKLEEPVISMLQKISAHKSPCVCIDVPSGCDGGTGTVYPHTLKADHTVTFFRKKLAHVLEPAKSQCGQIHLRQIGIDSQCLDQIGYLAYENSPSGWLHKFPQAGDNTHKYNKGHAVVYGGDKMTGAARLVAESCMRLGAGLCTLTCKPKAADVYRSSLPAHIIVRDEPLWNDPRVSARVIGPGAGQDVDKIVDKFIDFGTPAVLDADALSSLKTYRDDIVLTPHEGEFKRLFLEDDGSKFERVLRAAHKTEAAIVLKGSDTIIAQKGHKPVINIHSSPHLASAGTGDVLSGMIGSLLAQGMPAFDASCAAVWLHGEASVRLGHGMVASDIPDAIPAVLKELFQQTVFIHS